jgi:SdrD B-like domain
MSYGSSLNGGVNSFSINKRYVVNYLGTDYLQDTVVSGSSSILKVRLEYNNKSNFALSNAQIEDTLPAGFTLVNGSIRNCLTPDISTTFCSNALSDSLVSSNILRISPSSGLYDASSNSANGGTSSSASYGIMEIGKKRYDYFDACNIIRNSAIVGTFVQGSFGSNNEPFMGNSNSQGTQNCTPNSLQFSGNRAIIDNLNKRYRYFNTCSSSVGSFAQTSFGGNGEIFSGNSSLTGNENCTPNSFTFVGSLAIDTLGKRFRYFDQCLINGGGTIAQGSFGQLGEQFWGNSSSIGTNNCVPNGLIYSSSSVIDSLDNTRGKGYIEYQMTSPSTSGKYGSNASIKAGTTGGANPITTNATDNYIINGENEIQITTTNYQGTNSIVYMNGTSEVSSLQITPNQIITVRNKYNNTGLIGITNARITIDVPTGFTLVNNSFKNCLNPTTTELLCSGNFQPTGTVITGNQITISPSINLYDQGNYNFGNMGTSISSTNGIMNNGQKRYLKIVKCQTSNGGSSEMANVDIFESLLVENNNSNPTITCDNTNYHANPNFQYNSSLTTSYSIIDRLGKRFLTGVKCQTSKNLGAFIDYRQIELPIHANNGLSGDGIPTTSNCTSSSDAGLSNGYTSVSSSVLTTDTSNSRFLNIRSCISKSNSANEFITDDFLSFEASTGVSNIASGLTPCVGQSSIRTTSGNTHSPVSITLRNQDITDHTRGSGYIEFQIQAPSNLNSGTYGMSTRLNGNELNIPSTTSNMTYTPATINGKAFHDKNGDNFDNLGDTNLSGVSVDIKRVSDNAVIQTQTTSSNGLYNFSIPVGSYYLQLTSNPSGYTLVNKDIGSDTLDSDFDPITLRTDNFTVTAGQTVNDIDVGFNYPVNLQMVKTSSGGSDSTTNTKGIFYSGSSVYYDLSVFNIGTNNTLGNMSISDTFDNSYLTYTGFSGSNWNCTNVGNNVTCTNSNQLNTGSSSTVRLFFELE